MHFDNVCERSPRMRGIVIIFVFGVFVGEMPGGRDGGSRFGVRFCMSFCSLLGLEIQRG